MLHQVPAEWEVVDAYAVEPVRVYVEDDGATIVRLAPHEIVGAYTFDMAPPAPPRPPHRKRHSHDGSSKSKSTDSSLAPTTSRRGSHPATRPQMQEHHSAPASLPIPRTASPVPLPESSSASHSSHSHSSSSSHPKLTRLGTAFSFFRTHHGHSGDHEKRRRSSSPSTSSAEGSFSGSASGSGSSDGDSEAVPRRHLLGRRRGSGKAVKAEESHGLCSVMHKKSHAAPVVVENPAYRKADLKKALMFARAELMKQVEASGKNALVLEGWSITVFRQASRYRIRIEYTGRPAIISYSEEHVEGARRVPPFLEVIDRDEH